MRFRAERVHDFAWSLNPDYVYEEGRFGATVLRTFYLPQDRPSWGGGLVIARMGRLLAWMDTIFGAYPWPQFTALHRIEGGGTEFPMVVMNGGPSEGLIFHEGGHQYLYGILGNNEWKDGWLDEGFTSFQTSWHYQRLRPGAAPNLGTQQWILPMDLDGWSEPVATPAERFAGLRRLQQRRCTGRARSSSGCCGTSWARTPSAAGCGQYYARWQLKHVAEDALPARWRRRVTRTSAGSSRRWLHGTPLVDYARAGRRGARAPPTAG